MNAKLRALMLLAGCTVGGLSLSSCKEEEQEKFGFACVELQRGQTVDSDPFVGTYKVQIKMSYEKCLQDYYLIKQPGQRADGPADMGGGVFAEWKDRLCGEDVERRVECEVESVEQVLAEDSGLFNMTVTYLTPTPEAISGRRFLWGPGPLPEEAMCDAGQSPFVKLIGLSDIVGLDGQGNQLWKLQTFGSTQKAIIQSAGSGCLQAEVTNE